MKRLGRWLESDSARVLLLGLAALAVGLAVGLWTSSILSR